MSRRAGGDQRLPGPAEWRAREQLVAIDQVQQCLRFAAQGMDHMPIIGDVAYPAMQRPSRASPSRQGQHGRATEEALEPVVI
jgi:hypothetical protein